jgi:hypothetical protein
MEMNLNTENSKLNSYLIPCREKSYMAFFQDENYNHSNQDEIPINILYPNFIKNEKFKEFSNDLKDKRNKMLFICLFQILASCLGMAYMIFRRSYIYLAINLITLTLSFFGGYGSLIMNYFLILIHCIFTISLPGAFFLYTIIDYFLSRDQNEENKKRVSETLIFFIFSIPYLYDLFAGIFCFNFILSISKNLKEANKEKENMKNEFEILKKKYSKEEIISHFKNIDDNICIICCDSKRDTALSPCGHYLCCNKCANELFKMFKFAKPNCPICRKVCENYIKIILS